jgi:oligosaccharide repeat unit polymerase
MDLDVAPSIGFAVLCVLTAWLMWQPKKGRRVAAYVMVLYALIGVASAGCVVRLPSLFVPAGVPHLGYLYLCVLMTVAPLYAFREGTCKAIVLPRKNTFLGFCCFVVVVSLVGYISFLPSALDNAGGYTFHAIYEAKQRSDFEKTSLGFGNLPAVAAASMRDIVPFLTVVLMSIPGHTFLKAGMMASVVLSLMHVVLQAERGSMVFTSIVFLGTAGLLWATLPKDVRRTIKAVFGAVGVVLIVVFTAITVSRFGDVQYTNPVDSVLAYAGQPLLHFGEHIPALRTTTNGDMCFPVFRGLLGLEWSTTLAIRNHRWETVLGAPLGVFYTFVGDLIMDFGLSLTFVLLLLFSLFVYHNSRQRDTTADLHSLFALYVLLLIIAQGIFFFRYKTLGGNLQLVVFILTYGVLRVTAGRRPVVGEAQSVTRRMIDGQTTVVSGNR